MSGEVFYLQIEGEQRGPYTVRQIDHQLNSGLITEQATYWREGMEDWQPITNLVALRRPVKRWRLRATLATLTVLLFLLARFFGPIVLDGWREMAQYEFTNQAAYWKAREAIRRTALPAGAAVKFEPFAGGSVALDDNLPGATVQIAGEIMSGQTEAKRWKVQLIYNAEAKQWTSLGVESK